MIHSKTKSSGVQIIWLALALAWGSAHLFRTWFPTADPLLDLYPHPDLDSVAYEESVWRFGQLLPVILLALPLLGIWESYAGKWRENLSDRTSRPRI